MTGWRTRRSSGPGASSARPRCATCWRACSRRASLSRRPSVPALCTYDYAIVRVVPHVERGEFVNAGGIVACASRGFLKAGVDLDEARLHALDPAADIESIRAALAAIPAVCAGGAGAGAA